MKIIVRKMLEKFKASIFLHSLLLTFNKRTVYSSS